MGCLAVATLTADLALARSGAIDRAERPAGVRCTMLRRNLTPSFVISILALIVALGGVSYAAVQIPKNSVGAKQLKKNAVTAKKIKKNAIRSSKVKDRSLLATDFKEGQLPQGPKGATGARGPQGNPGPMGPAYRFDKAGGLLPLTAAFQPVVTSTTLPAGSYVLLSRANLLGGVGASSIICSILDDAAQGISVGANQNVALAQTATVTLDTPTAVTLNCLENSGAVEVAQASITAIEVAEIKTS